MVDQSNSELFVPKHQAVNMADWDSIKERLPNSLFRQNREKFFKLFHSKVETKEGDFCLVRGANEVPLYNSDIIYPEYQEAYFYYLTGV